jgi:hypothetical protein
VADDSVQVKFGAQIEGLLAGVNSAKDAISSITEPIGGIIDAFQGLSEAAVAGLAVDKVYDFEKGLAELGEQIERTSKMTGLSTDEVQEFGFAVRMTGGDSDSAAQSLLRFETNLGKAQSGSGPAAEAYKQLGISLQNADGTFKTISQILPEVADKFSQTADGATKVEYATAIGSRGFAQLIPLLDQGSAGLEKLNEKLAATNSKLSPEQVDALSASARAAKETHDAWDGFYKTIGSTAFFDKVNADMKDLAEAATQVAKAVQQANKAFDDFITGSEERIPTEAEKFTAAANQFKSAMAGYSSVYGPPAPAAKPSLAPLPEAGAGKEDDSGENQHTRAEMEVEQLRFQQKIQDINAEFNLQQITETRKIELLTQAANAQYAIDQKALDDALLTDQQYNDESAILYQKHTLEISRLNEQLAAAQKKTYEAELAPWKQLMSDMGGAADTMINGVLSGTQTWKQALVKSYDDLGIKFAEIMLKMTAEYLAFKATQTGANTASGILGFGTTNPFAALGGVAAGASGGAANAATQALTSAITGNTASTVSNTGGILQEIESGLQWIAQTLGLTTTTVAQTTATTAAATASTASATATTGLIPTITANIAALTANTSALIVSKAVPSFDVGTWSAPGGLSMLHPGEIVLPPSVSAGVRAGTTSIGGGAGASGGAVMVVNISAVDAQSVANLFKSNGGALASAMAAQMRNFNPNLRPS